MIRPELDRRVLAFFSAGLWIERLLGERLLLGISIFGEKTKAFVLITVIGGNMDFEDTEKIIEKAKTQPKKTIVIIIVFAIIAIAVAYATSFFSEKAKQHATPSKTTQKELSAPANSAGKSRNNEKTRNNYKIEQHTEGDQSPAIVSDGDVKIEYGDDK